MCVKYTLSAPIRSASGGVNKRTLGLLVIFQLPAARRLRRSCLDRSRADVPVTVLPRCALVFCFLGGGACTQLASQHQREIRRMETAQANEWTLMLMRHRTARRNCRNAIMVEQKKASQKKRNPQVTKKLELYCPTRMGNLAVLVVGKA